MFTKIDLANWERREHYHYYTNQLPCSYSMTVSLDVTNLKRRVKEYGHRFYPVFVYCVSKAVNAQKEFRMGMDGEGNPGYWDQVHPNFTIFHEDDHTFSDVWTEYQEEFESFYSGMTAVMEECKDKKGVKARAGQPANFYCISCVPWVCHILAAAGKLQHLINLIPGISARNPLHIADICTVHPNQIIKLQIILPGHLTGMMGDQRNSLLRQLPPCSVMGRIADLLPAGGRGVNIKCVRHAGLLRQVCKNGLGHGAAADVAVADE